MSSILETKASIARETSPESVALVAGAPDFVSGIMDKSLEDKDVDFSVSDTETSGATSVPTAVEMVATNCLREAKKFWSAQVVDMFAHKSATNETTLLLVILLPPIDPLIVIILWCAKIILQKRLLVLLANDSIVVIQLFDNNPIVS